MQTAKPASIVGVVFPMAVSGQYDYRVTPEFYGKIIPGTPVQVSLRNCVTWGIAIDLKTCSSCKTLKPVLSVLESRWTDESQTLLKLYRWIAAYYQCELGAVFKPLVRKRLLSASFKTAAESVAAGVKTGGGGYCLSQEQRQVLAQLSGAMAAPGKPFLLFGITGSGKTLVYIELVKFALARGKAAIILVPEISLTPQTIARFALELGPAIAVIHSRMSESERRRSITQLVTGAKRVAIGVRSAILAPLDNVGVIIVDEEHDASYKQFDPEPRYHARDVAVMRGQYSGALVVLGSATPSMESYQNALSGKYTLLRLTQRFGSARLPPVRIVDMSQEHKAGNWTLLSRSLHERITATLASSRQIILFLNRRGFSTMLLCQECSFSAHCPACSVHLVFHKDERVLKCHQCGYSAPAPVVCPKCGGSRIKYSGTGIQKAQEFLAEQFPGARILRMDQDTTRLRRAHGTIIEAFARREADILLGTQMVAKGLDFPGVALVGVLQADIGLHFPDFRATERTFQLLTQVAGRAGRNDDLGEVVIQTYMPQQAGILAAQQHDFEMFFQSEVKERQALAYPPFGKLARILAEGADRERLRSLMQSVLNVLKTAAGAGITALGPAPAVIARVKHNDRLSLLLKAASSGQLQRALRAIRAAVRPDKKIKLIIDVDPVNMI